MGASDSSEQCHEAVQSPHSPMQRDHLGTGTSPFPGAFPLEALGKNHCASTGAGGSAGGISQPWLKCQGVHMGFWQRFVLKEGGRGGGRRGHQSHLRDAPSCSSHPSSAAVGSVTAQKSLLEVPCRDSSVHLTAQLPSDKSETNVSVPHGLHT